MPTRRLNRRRAWRKTVQLERAGPICTQKPGGGQRFAVLSTDSGFQVISVANSTGSPPGVQGLPPVSWVEKGILVGTGKAQAWKWAFISREGHPTPAFRDSQSQKYTKTHSNSNPTKPKTSIPAPPPPEQAPGLGARRASRIRSHAAGRLPRQVGRFFTRGWRREADRGTRRTLPKPQTKKLKCGAPGLWRFFKREFAKEMGWGGPHCFRCREKSRKLMHLPRACRQRSA